MNPYHNDDLNFYCYSLQLHYFLLAFNEKCYTSKINKNSNTRYWVYHKSENLDKLISQYKKLKNKNLNK